MTLSLADGRDSVIGPTWQGPYNTGQRAATELKYCAVVDDAVHALLVTLSVI